MGYIDADHVAAFQTCWCVEPRADGQPVDDLSTLRVPIADLPSTVDPPNGVVTNWNEQMVTSGGDFVPPPNGAFRNDWFEAFNAHPTLSPATLVGAMNGMATKGLSGGSFSFIDFFPLIPGPRPPDIRATDRSTAIQLVMSFGSAGPG